MHWLERRLDHLNCLATRYLELKVLVSEDLEMLQRERVAACSVLLDATRALVEEVCQKPGVTGCFAAHDGLRLESSGSTLDFEALAATSQQCVAVGKDAARSLALGTFQQMVVVGSEHKVALLLVRHLSIGVIPPKSSDLAELLA